MNSEKYALYHEILTQSSILSLAQDPEELFKKYEKYFVSVEAGDMLFSDGQSADHLFICLNSEVDLLTRVNGELRGSGRLKVGQSAQLFHLLRSGKFDGSGRAVSDGDFLKIPNHEFQLWLAADPALKKHLLRVTESLEYRHLSKSFDGIELDPRFKLQFLSYVSETKMDSRSWLAKEGETPTFAFFLLQGTVQALKFGDNNDMKSLWTVPYKTWMLFKETSEARASRQSLKLLDEARFFQITAADLKNLQAQYPEEFESFKQWLLTAHATTKEDTDVSTEVDNIEDLFVGQAPFKRGRWKKFPWVQQNDQMDCGPACMAMLSQYFDKNLNIQYWRSQLSTDKEGTNLFDLSAIAERNGFIAQALSLESLADLDPQMLPAIILRKYHYCVLYKLEGGYATLGDPGAGIVKMPIREFRKGLENAVLFLKPKPEFFSLPETGSSYRHFLSLFNGLKWEIMLTLICSIAITGLSLFPPVFSQIMLDEVLSRRDEKLFQYTLGGAVLTSLLVVLLTWARSYYIAYISTKFEFQAKSLFLAKLFSLQYNFFSSRHIGDFTRRLNEMDKVREFLTGNFARVMINLVMVSCYFFVVFSYHMTIGIALAIMAPVFVLISMAFSKSIMVNYSETFSKNAETDSFLADILKAVATVKSLGAELSTRWKIEEKLVQFLQRRQNLMTTATLSQSLGNLYYNFVKYTTFGLAVYFGIRGELSPGQVIALGMIVDQIIQPLLALAEDWSEIQQVKAVLNRLNDVLLAPSEVGIVTKGVKLDKLKGEIEFRDVWFRYGGESSDWALKGVSFKIEAGQKVAIVGASGSGKSTIASLLVRLYTPTKGQIFIDGRDYMDYNLEWLRTQLGLLLQESHLFQGTLAENISFNNPTVDLAHVEKSAQSAAASQFIHEKSAGLGYYVTHGGMGLSGGEKQRIALARLFYQNPSVFILDEATSSLDGIAEQEILQQLRTAAANMTIINIAHRYSTVRASDYIILMSKGRVIEYGTNEDLEANSEIYRQLFGFYFSPKQLKGAA